MTTTVNPEEVHYVLLRGEDDWLSVNSMEPGVWRLEDGGPTSRGKRGWIIVLADGERIVVEATAIVGVR